MQEGFYMKPKIDEEFTSKKKKSKNKYDNSAPQNPMESSNSNENSGKNEQIFEKDREVQSKSNYSPSKNSNTKQEEYKANMLLSDKKEKKNENVYQVEKNILESNLDSKIGDFEFLQDFDGEIDMVKEHDDLYDECSVIIGNAIDRNDEEGFEDLLMLCDTNVYYVIEEEQRDDFEYFANDPEVKKIQEYILKQIEETQKKNKIDTGFQNFPSLGSSVQQSEPKQKKTVYEKLLSQGPRSSSQMYDPLALKRDGWDSRSENNLVHQGNKPGSTREIIKLCKHFPALELTKIKIAYTNLDEDFEATKKYLSKEYPKDFVADPKKEIVRVQHKKSESPSKKYNFNFDLNEDEVVEKILKEMNYEEIRGKVTQLSKIKFILERTAAQARGIRKYNDVYGIESAAKDQANKLSKFSKASKKYIFNQVKKNNEFYEVDLHGLFWEEAKEIVPQILNLVWERVNSEPSKYKYNSKYKDGKKILKYTIITGKGIHSKNKVPVLFNNLCKYFDEKRIPYEPLKNEGQILVYIEL